MTVACMGGIIGITTSPEIRGGCVLLTLKSITGASGLAQAADA